MLEFQSAAAVHKSDSHGRDAESGRCRFRNGSGRDRKIINAASAGRIAKGGRQTKVNVSRILQHVGCTQIERPDRVGVGSGGIPRPATVVGPDLKRARPNSRERGVIEAVSQCEVRRTVVIGSLSEAELEVHKTQCADMKLPVISRRPDAGTQRVGGAVSYRGRKQSQAVSVKPHGRPAANVRRQPRNGCAVRKRRNVGRLKGPESDRGGPCCGNV